MTPSRILVVLLPLVAVLGLPILRQIDVCCGHDDMGQATVAVLHWAGDCPCESAHHDAGPGGDDAACDADAACGCSDVPLVEDDTVTLVVAQPIPLQPILRSLSLFDLACAIRPSPGTVSQARRPARAPPTRADPLTHLACVRLLI